jgi:hypothetical protein
MALQRSQTADKNIVDRRKAHRNSDVAKAVRRTRDRLSQREGIPDFDRELLKIHARAVVNSATAIPLLMVVIGVGGLFAGMSREILLWTVAAITCYAVLALVAKRADEAELSEIDPAKARRSFLLGHFLSGLGWAYFALFSEIGLILFVTTLGGSLAGNWLDEQTGHAMPDDLGHPAHGRGDDGPFERHRFEEGQREAFLE